MFGSARIKKVKKKNRGYLKSNEKNISIFKFESIDNGDDTFKFDSVDNDAFTFDGFRGALSKEEENSTTSFEFGGDSSDSSFTFLGSPIDDTKGKARKTKKNYVFLDKKDDDTFVRTRSLAIESFPSKFEIKLDALSNFQVSELSRDQFFYAICICWYRAAERSDVLNKLVIDHVYETSLGRHQWFPQAFSFLNVKDLTKCTQVSRSVYFLSLNTLVAHMFHTKRSIISDNIGNLPIKMQASFVSWVRVHRRRVENMVQATRIKQAYLALRTAMLSRRFDAIEVFLRRASGDMLGNLTGYTWRLAIKEFLSVLYARILFKILFIKGYTGEKILSGLSKVQVFWKKDIQKEVENLCERVDVTVRQDTLDQIFTIVISDFAYNKEESKDGTTTAYDASKSVSRASFCRIFDGLALSKKSIGVKPVGDEEEEKFAIDLYDYILEQERRRGTFIPIR